MLNTCPQTPDDLKERKETLSQYINNLRLLMSRISFGAGNHSVQIDFSWTDTIKNIPVSMKNCSYEYFCALYNFGVLNFVIAEIMSNESEATDDRLKEAIKHYQYAAGVFENIKQEGVTSISQKDLPSDMTPFYLTFYSSICQALGQINLLKVASRKKTNFELQAQLAKGIEELFSNASMIANEAMKKQFDDSMRYYLINRMNYYEAVSYEKMKGKVLEQFDKNGEGYGKAIACQNGIIDLLSKNAKDQKKLKGLDPKGDELQLLGEEKQVTEMHVKNKIYFSPIPDYNTLPKPEKKIMANPVIPPELKTDITSRKELDSLIPKEVREMCNQYKNQMNGYISSAVNTMDNESTIQSFLNQLGLPSSLESVVSQSEISDSLWKKISDIQSKGGAVYLTNTLQVIEKEPDELLKRLNDSFLLLENEENEDNKYRQQYSGRWNRKPSNALNMAFKSTLEDKKAKLDQAKDFGNQIKQDVMNGMNNFELLKLSRHELNQRIPKKVESNQIAKCNEASLLRNDLDQLENAKERCMELIGKLFNTLTEENVTAQCMEVAQNKSTFNDVFESNKEKYSMIIGELQEVGKTIEMLKICIDEKNKAFLKVKESGFKENPENEEFFKKLDYYEQFYHEKELLVQQGVGFYKQFNNELNEFNRNITDFLSARDMEKNILIRDIMQGMRGGNVTTVQQQPQIPIGDLNKQQPDQYNIQQPQYGRQPGQYNQPQSQYNQQPQQQFHNGQQPGQYNQPQPQYNQQALFGQQYQQPYNQQQYGQQPYSQQQFPYGQQQGFQQYPSNQTQQQGFNQFPGSNQFGQPQNTLNQPNTGFGQPQQPYGYQQGYQQNYYNPNSYK